MISYVIPTHNRLGRLETTVRAIAALGPHDAEIVVVDNASETPVRPVATDLPLTVHRVGENMGAAARNVGVACSDPRSKWIVMLDDDSHPVDLQFLDALDEAPSDVVAVSADIHVPEVGREAGGLPEVFVGCGVAIRRSSFVDVGGYDASFVYYAEEYDLAARLLLAGGRIAFEPGFRILHHRSGIGRDMNRILRYLVRNTGWVTQRYTPEAGLEAEMRCVIERCRWIAEREGALSGFEAGLAELTHSRGSQARLPMTVAVHARFSGLHHAREALGPVPAAATVALVAEGRNGWVVRKVLEERGAHIVADPDSAEFVVVATMSPGPMLDARDRWAGCHPSVLVPWTAAMPTDAVAALRPACAAGG